jgi:hypothetical protein
MERAPELDYYDELSTLTEDKTIKMAMRFVMMNKEEEKKMVCLEQKSGEKLDEPPLLEEILLQVELLTRLPERQTLLALCHSVT